MAASLDDRPAKGGTWTKDVKYLRVKRALVYRKKYGGCNE